MVGLVLLLNFKTAFLIVKEHKYTIRAGILELETFDTQKILVLVRLCTWYFFEKAIEYRITLSNGKASCRSALKCRSNFILPHVMSKYITKSVCSSLIVQIQ